MAHALEGVEMIKHTLTALALAWASLGAQAIEYKSVVAHQSDIAFGYKQMGVAMEGRFKTFSANLNVDPAKLAQAKVSIEVALASFDTGTEADDEVAGKAWFNTQAFPKALFTARQIKAITPQQWEVTGSLSIKGKSVDVKFPLQYVAQGKTGVFKGTLSIRRADFNIGEGNWSKFDIVANDVQIRFQLTAQ
jgi:polyisoprenoid-binding protein YceI